LEALETALEDLGTASETLGRALEAVHDHSGGREAGYSARAEGAPESLPLLQAFAFRK
jgi:hypothetical protein